MKQKILFEKSLSTGIITLNDPENLNLIEYNTFENIENILKKFENDNEIKVILIQAVCGISKSGKKVFSAGVNLKKYDEKFELVKKNPDQFKQELKKARALMTKIEQCKKPVIIGIDGIITGGFFELALSCDVILASSSAIFSLNEVNIGLIPGYGGIHRLLRIVGKNKAFEIIATAQKITALDALNLGIVVKIFEDSKFKAQVVEYCKNLALKPSNSLFLIKDSIQNVLNGQNIEEIEVNNFVKAISSQEAKEGIKSFLEKNFN